MTLTQQVEQVLDKWLIRGKQPYGLCADLVALIPPPVSCSRCCGASRQPLTLCTACAKAVSLHPTTPPDRGALSTILGGHCGHIELAEQLYDKLMIWAHPRPLRKADLEQIFRQHFRKYASPEEWQREIIEAIWRWVMGQESRVWCEHLVWDEKMQCFAGVATDLASLTLEGWKQCPVCLTARPTEEA